MENKKKGTNISKRNVDTPVFSIPGTLPELPGMSSVLLVLLTVVSDLPNVLSGTPRCSQISSNHSHGTPVLVITDPSYSKCLQECPPRVWYSPEIDASKFILHILADPVGGFQRLQYILLMYILSIGILIPKHIRVANNHTRCTVYI